ncbi:MAG: 2Fe-2S iron-sulfur cluster binding domain-containing protein, partial [Chloroflexi bacterium]|nr:2Fe-2S iron-sulfur cluster binding domain-containing protein [Chloroflexota bacterium]
MSEQAIVVFKPSGRVIEVQVGTLLSDAAVRAGIDIAMPCGGQGRCGRCLVQVEYGEVARKPSTHLSSADVEKGHALACLTVIKGNVVVVVPTKEEVVRRVSVEAKAEKIALPVVCEWQREPGIQKCFVQMEPPSLMDNTNDADRLKRALAVEYDVRDLIVELPMLQELARTLREADWAVTAVLERQNWGPEDLPSRLIGLLPGDCTATSYGLAVDIGTTTVTVYLTDLLTTEVMDIASAYNAQISCGEDVISRIVYAQKGDGLQHLQRLIIKTINELLAELASRNRIDLREMNEMVVAGNTTM